MNFQNFQIISLEKYNPKYLEWVSLFKGFYLAAWTSLKMTITGVTVTC